MVPFQLFWNTKRKFCEKKLKVKFRGNRKRERGERGERERREREREEREGSERGERGEWEKRERGERELKIFLENPKMR